MNLPGSKALIICPRRFYLSEVVWEEKQASESGEEVTEAKTNIEPDDDDDDDDGIEIN